LQSFIEIKLGWEMMIKHRPQICDQSKRRFSPISPGIVQIQQPTDLLNFDELLSQNTL
jgi:hypothetical protein